MKSLTVQEVVEIYVTNGEISKEATLSGDYKTNNKEGKKLAKVFKLLAINKELALEALPILFNHPNVVTRTNAAVHCLKLGIFIEQAIIVLSKIVNNETTNIFGFNAEMALKVWRGEISGKTL